MLLEGRLWGPPHLQPLGKAFSPFRMSVILKIKCPLGTSWPMHGEVFLAWCSVVFPDVTYQNIPIQSLLLLWLPPTIAAPTPISL